jgi:hypothetical protein
MAQNTLLVDGGPLTDRVRTFYQHKEIQRAYNFLVYFNLSDDEFTKGGPPLAPFHAVSIEIPNYTFDKDWLEAGPIKKAFPILKHDGFEFTIKFEEDNQATIQKLIRRLTSRNLDSLGFNRPYKNTVLDEIVASVYTQDAWNIYKIYFKNCFFMRASTANYDFYSGDKIAYDITFNADHYVIQDRIGERV